MESEKTFGKKYEGVHRWLDEYFAELGPRHRRKRHHQKGIDQVAELFGEEAAKAARQHIISDLKQEGWEEDDPFPRNEQEYVKIGLF